ALTDYAFQSAHAYLAWGPDVLKVYEKTHRIDRVVHTGFWGFPEYRKASLQRDSLRQSLNIPPTTRLLVFYDIPYFPERSLFTSSLLYDLYETALRCSKIPDVAIMLKMKNRHNENVAFFPADTRKRFETLWQEIRSRPNIQITTTLDWDPLKMI